MKNAGRTLKNKLLRQRAAAESSVLPDFSDSLRRKLMIVLVMLGVSFGLLLAGGQSAAAQAALDGFNPNADGTVYAIAVQPDGKIIIGGDFSSVLGTARSRIARLNPDGTLDTGFNPNANIGGTVRSIAIQSDGKILVGGQFLSIGGQTRFNIARLNTDGTADSFDPSASVGGAVLSIAVQPDGKILVGGAFGSIGGQARNRIARLNTDGTADSFNPNANDTVESIAVQSDGKILVGGFFQEIGGQARNFIARLNTDGTADSFNPNASLYVLSIAVQADGKILVNGFFSSIGGQARATFARLNTDGTVDSFNPNCNGGVSKVAIQPDGKILVGGAFTTIGGQARNRFARLSNNTAALSSLSVSQSEITLTRDGSAAQFTRVVFEQSVDDGSNWTTLGQATNSFASHTLTGLNLPTGQNILIRARGYFRTGYFNGSETIEDKVQIAFLEVTDTTPPVITPTVTGTLGNNGWYTSNVQVSWSVADGESTVSNQTGCGAQTVSTDTAGVTFTCEATSVGGMSSQSVTVKRDATAPTVNAAATTSPNAAGWYKTDVTVQFTCADSLSGIVSGACPADQTLSAEGSAVSSTPQIVTDNAGNTSSPSNVVTVSIDKTAPALAPTVMPNPVNLNASATASANATDALSGVASQSCAAVDTSSAGNKTVACTATDNAGNVANANANYQVVNPNVFNFTGFFQPVDNLPLVNIVNAGQGVPLRFSLGGNQGLNILAAGYPISSPIACDASAPGDVIEETVNAGGSSLSYDATTDRYSYVWKTNKAWKGTCRMFVLRLSDGSEHFAKFRFK